MSLSSGEVHSLLFGGQNDGDIVLLHSTKGVLSMAKPHPSHDNRLTMLVGASDIIPNTYRRSDGNLCVQSALVSYGERTKQLCIWTVTVNEESLKLGLEILLIVNMSSTPHFVALTGNTVCVAMGPADANQLHMFRNRTIRKPFFVPQLVNFTSLGLLSHRSEDRHLKPITSLSTCPYLRLFVTSSKDGTIKIWDFDNHMISEIDFEMPLTSVTFANDRGDLLVALQLHISKVRAEDYLPSGYCPVVRNCPCWDDRETPVPFDPNLAFWSVCERIALTRLVINKNSWVERAKIIGASIPVRSWLHTLNTSVACCATDCCPLVLHAVRLTAVCLQVRREQSPQLPTQPGEAQGVAQKESLQGVQLDGLSFKLPKGVEHRLLVHRGEDQL